MTGRHTGWMRFRKAAASLAPLARKLMGEVMEQRRLGNLFQHSRTVNLPDGTRMRARFDGTTPIVEIAPADTATDEAAVSKQELWIPDGFVLYPAAAAAPAGWGVPVQHVGDEPYAAENLAPGLAPARWTENGPLGQVLLTRRAGAGYPRRNNTLLPPLTYDATKGIRLTDDWQPASSGEWAAYRIEFTGFSAQSPGAPLAERVAQVQFKRGVFELVNEHRAGLSDRDPLLLPVRGIYDSAQASAECVMASSTLGHMHAGFPLTYRTTEDRISHDGLRRFDLNYNAAQGYNPRSYNFNENLLASFLGAPTVIGADPNGVDILQGEMRRSPMFTAPEAVEIWLDSPTHRAMIEREEHNVVPGCRGRASVTNVGVKGSACAQHFMPTQEWIAGGNRQFVSQHAEVPIVSWFAPTGLNLAWETWPCRFRMPELVAQVGEPEAGLDPLEELGRIVDEDGQCRLFRYYEMAADEGDRISQEPIWQPYLFVRGRCIGIAPGGALIWAAGVIKVDATTHRLVILTHHDDEQPAGIENGQTSLLRVWYCDIPMRDGLALNPQSLIRGVYGEELTDDPWPWTLENNPWSWRGGQQLDVGTSNGTDRDCLKYASQWVFRADGLQAVCLRDNAKLHDYLRFLWPVEEGETLPPYSNNHLLINTGLFPSQWTMDLSTGAAPLTASVTWEGRSETVYPELMDSLFADLYPDLPALTYPANFEGYVYGTPLAVGYDSNGILRTAKLVEFYDLGFYPTQIYAVGVSWGEYDATYYESLWDGWGSTFKYSAGTIDRPYWSRPIVLDMADRAYVTVGVPQKFRIDTIDGGEVQPVSYVDTVREAVNWNGIEDDYATVQMWRGGEMIRSQRFPNPDGTAIAPDVQFCFLLDNPIGGGGSYFSYGPYLPLIDVHTCTASYARNGSDWIFSVNFQPQPFLALAAVSASCGECASFVIGGGPTPGCIPHTMFDTGAAPYGLVGRGGMVVSSIGNEAALYALMQTPDDSPRVLYARAV